VWQIVRIASEEFAASIIKDVIIVLIDYTASHSSNPNMEVVGSSELLLMLRPDYVIPRSTRQYHVNHMLTFAFQFILNTHTPFVGYEVLTAVVMKVKQCKKKR
jgi:hypothetical protein